MKYLEKVKSSLATLQENIQQTINFISEQDKYYLDEEIQQKQNISLMLLSKNEGEIIEGLKFLIAKVSRSQEFEQIEWKISPLMSHANLEIKFLSYMVVEIYNNTHQFQKETLVLVNPILKDFMDLNPLIQGNALWVLPLLYHNDIKDILFNTLLKGTKQLQNFLKNISLRGLFILMKNTDDQQLQKEIQHELENLMHFNRCAPQALIYWFE